MPASAAVEILRAAGIAAEGADEPLGAVVRLACGRIGEALAALSSVGHDQLVDLFGTDTGEAIELTYHVRVLAEGRDLYVKVTTGYDTEVPSVWRVYPAALYPEREAAEMFGLTFPGHPNPKRLLTVEDSEPLLRKSVEIRTDEEVWIR